MTLPEPSRLFPRGIVLFHECLVSAGGAERLVVEEYRYFRRRGVPVRLLAFEARSAATFGLRPEDVEILSRRSIVDGVLQLRRRLAELRPDLVIVASGLRDLFLATGLGGPPYLLHQHEAPYKAMVLGRHALVRLVRKRAVDAIRRTAYGYLHVPGPAPAASFLERVKSEALSVLDHLAIRRAAAVTVLSKRAANEIRLLHDREALAACGCLTNEILTYRPSRRQELRQVMGLERRRVILSICRLDPLKRLDIVIRAYHRLSSRHRDVTLLLGGVGPDERRLKDLAKALALDDGVRFLGFVPDGDLWEVLGACDAFVCADWTDFDIAPYEALALGCPVVWSSEMETDEWLQASGAVHSVDPTVNDLADGMERALSTPRVDRERLTDHLRQYTWDVYFAEVMRIAARCAKSAFDRPLPVGWPG